MRFDEKAPVKPRSAADAGYWVGIGIGGKGGGSGKVDDGPECSES